MQKTTYTALVRSRLEYASCIFDPHTDKNRKQIESVQRRSARYIYNSYGNRESVTQMLKEQSLVPLSIRRVVQRHHMLDRISAGEIVVQHFCCANVSLRNMAAPTPTQCRYDFLTRTLSEIPMTCSPPSYTHAARFNCTCMPADRSGTKKSSDSLALSWWGPNMFEP